MLEIQGKEDGKMKKWVVSLICVLLLCCIGSSSLAEAKIHVNQTPPADWQDRDLLRLIAFKVTPCDAMLLQCGGESMMVDSGTRKFARVLEHCGVYKETEAGQAGFERFIDTVSRES